MKTWLISRALRKRLIEQVKRNLERFPGHFIFPLGRDETVF
jgi:hypothetical protein